MNRKNVFFLGGGAFFLVLIGLSAFFFTQGSILGGGLNTDSCNFKVVTSPDGQTFSSTRELVEYAQKNTEYSSSEVKRLLSNIEFRVQDGKLQAKPKNCLQGSQSQ